MITAIDTNVLLDLLIPNEKFFELSLRAVEEAASEGSLVVCDVVYGELCITSPPSASATSFWTAMRFAWNRSAGPLTSWQAGSGARIGNKAAGHREFWRIFPSGHTP